MKKNLRASRFRDFDKSPPAMVKDGIYTAMPKKSGERFGISMFRRKWGTTVWHVSPECSGWPAPLDSEERDHLPPNSDVCKECLAKRRQ